MGVSTSKPHPIKTKWFYDFEENLPNLEGKTIAVTGCTSGTGFVVARTSIKKGASNVLLLNRASERASKAEEELKSLVVNNKTTVETIPCDLQDFESVRKAAHLIQAKYDALDVLVNNAGVMAMEDVATKDGYDIQMQTNHLSHFLLTKELYPLLKRAKELRGEARVVNHSSGARHGEPLKAEYFEKNGGNLGGNGRSWFFGGPRWERYHQSKLANVVFTLGLKDRFGDSGVKAVVACPGAAATNLQATSNQSGGMSATEMWLMYFFQSAEDGSMPIHSACFDPSTENGDFWAPTGITESTGPAVKIGFSKLCLDDESRRLLWEKSEEACGKFEIN